MITKIYFPIVNTDSLTYESDIKLTNEAYDAMVSDNYQRSRGIMNDFYQNGFSARNNNYYGMNTYGQRRDYSNVSDYVEYMDAEALLTEYGKGDLTKDTIVNFIDNQKMCILEININPDSIDYDVETEVKTWIGDSNNINRNTSIDNKQKMNILSGKDIEVDVPEVGRINLMNCKILQDNSTRNSPMNVIVIVEKIILK